MCGHISVWNSRNLHFCPFFTNARLISTSATLYLIESSSCSVLLLLVSLASYLNTILSSISIHFNFFSTLFPTCFGSHQTTITSTNSNPFLPQLEKHKIRDCSREQSTPRWSALGAAWRPEFQSWTSPRTPKFSWMNIPLTCSRLVCRMPGQVWEQRNGITNVNVL